jgi:PKD repeat protein
VTNATGLTNTDFVEITVNSQPSPVANAGSDIVISLPSNAVSLDGSASYQPGGGTLTYAWVVTSGPTVPAVIGAGTATPMISPLVQGVYLVNLTVTNASGGTAVSSITITVNAAVPASPVANAGGSKSMTLPDNSASLDGSASYNPAGGTLSYAWAKIAGPGSFSISGGNTATPMIIGLAKGIYQVGLTVTNAQGLTATDIISITVNPGLVPVAKTGADTTVNFPKGFALLDGSASYALNGASITKYSWRQVSGPTYVLFGNDSMPNTSVGNLEPGDYVIELTVTDSKGLTGSTRVKISVVNTFRNNKIITLYPNPCTTQVNVHLISDQTGPLTIRITSTSGVIVYTQAFQKPQLQFDQLIPTGSLPSGMYVMEVIIGSQVQLLQKFIKQ